HHRAPLRPLQSRRGCRDDRFHELRPGSRGRVTGHYININSKSEGRQAFALLSPPQSPRPTQKSSSRVILNEVKIPYPRSTTSPEDVFTTQSSALTRLGRE